MKNKQFLVYHPSQLNTLSTLPWAHRSGVGTITFDKSFLHPEKEKFEKELNKAYHACGCDMGAKALIIGLIVCTVIGGWGYLYADWSAIKTIATALGGAVVMALAGKFLGLIMANNQLKQTVKSIQADWKPHWPESKIVGCG